MTQDLVTGGAGFIGGHVAQALVKRGDRVRVIDDFSSGYRRNLAEVRGEIELIEGDVRDADTVKRAMHGVEVCYHLAAQGSVPKSVEIPLRANNINVDGSLNVLIAARDAGVRRVVYSASSSAYGDTPTLPKIESMRPQPLSPYAVSKLAAEHYCLAFSKCYGLQTISLRYFNVFGPRQDPSSQYAAVIPAFVSRMIAGKQPIVFGDGEQSRDFCYVDNVVEANLLAAAAPNTCGQAVNIACGERITLNRIIDLINQRLGTDIQPQYCDSRSGDVRHSLADVTAARDAIGYVPKVMFEEGLKRCIAWYNKNA
jgi:UDP-glucose 4-epimerase